MKNLKINIFFLVMMSFFTGTCGGGEMKEKKIMFKSLKEVPAREWARFSKKSIYFGHQSVGYNIVEGISDLMKENPQIGIKIVETSNPAKMGPGIFAHSKVGKNVDPESKIDDFAEKIDKGIGGKVDIAFFKFCYVDIHSKTDLEKLYGTYRKTMDLIENRHPRTIFAHMTVPLTARSEGVRAMINGVKDILKKMLGKINMYDNRIKFEFNEMIRKRYGETALLFDLARAEATVPGKQAPVLAGGGEKQYFLASRYTDDGGHLNELGRKVVAEKLLLFLVNRSR